MTTDWHRSEPKTLRPFFETQTIESLTTNSAIKISPTSNAIIDEIIDIDEIELRRLQPSIVPNIVFNKELLPKKFKTNELDLVIFARNSFLKDSVIIGSYALDSKLPDEIAISSEVLNKLGGGRDLRLTVALVLNVDKDPQPGSPFLTGHWLSAKTFHLKERKIQSMFDVQTRTGEEWVLNGYPAKTLYSVVYIGGIDSAEENSGPIADVHIHIEASNQMAGERAGEILEPLLGVEMIAQVLEQSFEEWRDYPEAPDGSPLLNLTKKIVNSDKPSLNELKKLVNNPPMLRAVLQDKIDALGFVTSRA